MKPGSNSKKEGTHEHSLSDSNATPANGAPIHPKHATVEKNGRDPMTGTTKIKNYPRCILDLIAAHIQRIRRTKKKNIFPIPDIYLNLIFLNHFVALWILMFLLKSFNE